MYGDRELRIIHKNCEKEISKDKSLPRNSYIVTYENDGELTYDIVQSNSKVEIFDHYYDNYRSVKAINWTDGTKNPIASTPEKSKKKK